MAKPKKPDRRVRTMRRYVDGDLKLSRCPKCGSTERTKYFKLERHTLPPHWFHEAQPATHVVYRYTRCKCGAWRRDRSFENQI